MKNKEKNPLDQSRLFYVDIPTEDCVNSDSDAWHNAGEFDAEAAALAFATKHFRAAHRGRVFLVPSQVDELQDKLEMVAAEMVAVLKTKRRPFGFGSRPKIPEVAWHCRPTCGMA